MGIYTRHAAIILTNARIKMVRLPHKLHVIAHTVFVVKYSVLNINPLCVCLKLFENVF